MCATSHGRTGIRPTWWPTSTSAHPIPVGPSSPSRWNSRRTRVGGSYRREPPTCCWLSGPHRSRLPRPHPATNPTMWIGWLEFDVLLGDVRSLKQKRSVIRPVVAELQRKFSVSAAETGSHGLYRRANIGVAVASGDRSHAVDVLDAAERLVAAHPEFELLSVRRGIQRSDDW